MNVEIFNYSGLFPSHPPQELYTRAAVGFRVSTQLRPPAFIEQSVENCLLATQEGGGKYFLKKYTFNQRQLNNQKKRKNLRKKLKYKKKHTNQTKMQNSKKCDEPIPIKFIMNRNVSQIIPGRRLA